MSCTQHWLLRVGDGNNFKSSSQYGIWGIQSTVNCNKYFIKNAKPDDIVWFVTQRSEGKVIGVATYCYYNIRQLGPLINMTMTNHELGWVGDDWESDIEIHYSNLCGLEECNLLTKIKAPLTIRKYNSEKCNINLPKEYKNIQKYCKITIGLN
jgi:hypothetical protein